MLQKIKFFLAPAFWGNRGSLYLVLIRNIFFGINGTIVAISMQNIIDGVNAGNYSIAYTWVTIMSIFYLIQDMPSYFFRNAYNKRFYGLKVLFYQKYMGEYFTADNNTIEGWGTGKIQSIIFGGCNAWQNTLSNIMQMGIRLLISIVLGFVIIAHNLGFVGFVIIIIIFGGSYIFVQYGNMILAHFRKERRDIQIEGDKRFVRMIMSKNEILQNNKTNVEKTFMQKHYDTIFSMRLRESKKQFITFDMQKLIFTIIRIGIVLFAIYQIKIGHYTIGTLGLLWMLVNQIHGSIMDLNDNITQFHQDKINIDKLRDLFKETPQIKGYNYGNIFYPKNGSIELKNITYNYGKGEVLNSFSLSIQGGKKTALIGISGSGKSTLIKLIAGYLYPQQGTVLIDNQELPNPNNSDFVSLQSYYKHIGYLTQEPSVFDGSIYENLTYALNHEPTDEEIQKAINGAQCQFVNDFPEGVQTQIGEKGVKLSGGQRQRLAIAKVLLKNPNIILLDEPTSALDSFSEDEVTKAFNVLFQGRTVVIIAHRLQTVKNADKIIVLEKGHVVEEGTHVSLTASGGVYAKMLELQSGF